MVKQAVTIQHETGLHARPASKFVKTANQFQSTIMITTGTKRLNAKSIISVLGAGISQGTEIVLEAEGADEAAAVQSLVELIASGFGE